MLDRLVFLFVFSLIFSGCTSKTPDIRVVCQRDDIGNYVIKWETFPQMTGTMKLYVSDDLDYIQKDNPVITTDIREGRVTYITNDNITRKYFRLSFNDKYIKEASSRSVRMEEVQNLRDLGGYQTKDGKTTRWGKLYRSGKLTELSEWDALRLNNLRIKTIVDLRSETEVEISPIQYSNAKIIHIPTTVGNFSAILEKIREKRLRKGDGLIFMQDLYLQFVEQQSAQFGEALRVLLEKENYPILFNSSLGKDRGGFLVALLLLALDIPESTVMQDYMASNDFLDLKRFEDMVKGLDTEAQETITLLLTANEMYMDIALNKIRKEYGTYQKYLSKELNLTEKEQTELKEIMLY